MRRLGSAVVLAAFLAVVPLTAHGQAPVGGAVQFYGPNARVYAPPGLYGMAYGFPGFGYPRTYTAFSSPYGAGYGYGYGPSSFLPGRFGVGLWRPGFVAPGYVYGASYYRTFPVPYSPLAAAYSPPVGVYAPYFGPGYYAW